MTKYSTGDSISGDNKQDSCAICGSQENLQLSKIENNTVKLCRNCRQGSDKISQSETENRQRDGVGGYTITDPDSSWVKENRPDYGNKTPYLVNNYNEDVRLAINEQDLSKEDICEDTDIEENELDSIISGSAISDSVGVTVVEELEDYLSISIQEDF